MQLTDWIPGLSSAALLAAGLWLARNVIYTRLTKSVEFEFNRKLEELSFKASSPGRCRMPRSADLRHLKLGFVLPSPVRSASLGITAAEQLNVWPRMLAPCLGVAT